MNSNMSNEHFYGELILKQFTGENLSLEGVEIKNLRNMRTEINLGNQIADVGFVYNENQQGYFEYIWSNPISFDRKFKYWEKNKVVIGVDCHYEYKYGRLPNTIKDLKTLFKARMYFINNPYSGIQFWDKTKSKFYKIVTLHDKTAFYLITDTRCILISYSQISSGMKDKFKAYSEIHHLQGYIANIRTKEDYKEFIRRNELIQI